MLQQTDRFVLLTLGCSLFLLSFFERTLKVGWVRTIVTSKQKLKTRRLCLGKYLAL